MSDDLPDDLASPGIDREDRIARLWAPLGLLIGAAVLAAVPFAIGSIL